MEEDEKLARRRMSMLWVRLEDRNISVFVLDQRIGAKCRNIEMFVPQTVSTDSDFLACARETA
jgi:hypothetical protein